ncbi:MAG: hypothetical protein M0R51_13090 [Clostridia bacterium]|jgi:hypothetical protein|nr:hypothetical protein [Clostridia bacterium]
MDKNELIKQGIAEAEKEAQEKEIAFIKGVAKRYLEDIQSYKTKEEETKAKRKILESELADLKSGRLDKIKERQDKDEKCRDISPIIVIVVNNNYPLKPWLNEYSISWRNNIPSSHTGLSLLNNTCYTTTTSSANNSMNTFYANTLDDGFLLKGTTCQAMATGAYDVMGKIINL